MKDNWTEKQKRIHEGLSAIGQEIAGFYEAALTIYFGDCLVNGAYFLLHSAREIDGGLRDVLAIDYNPDDSEQNKNKKSILFSLGEAELEGLAEDWFEATKKLHQYAHRHGAWKSPRQLNEVKPIWDQYENILERLVGSYYAIIERIEHIGKIENLQGSVVETLCNILAVPVYYNYYFRTEKKNKWFIPLKERDWFLPAQIKYDDQGNALFWNALDYLERVSEQLDENPEYSKDLINIIDNLVKHSQNKKKINNHYIWWYCVKILNNIPVKLIDKNLCVERFHIWLEVWTDHSNGNDLTISDIGVKLLPKFLVDDSAIKYAEAVIDVITEIKVSGKYPVTKRQDAILAWDAYWIRDTFKKSHQLIGEKCSLNAIFGIADKLKKALQYKQKRHPIYLEIEKSIYQIEVQRIFSEGLKTGEIGFKEGYYKCIIGQFSKDQVKDVDFSNNFLALTGVIPQINVKVFDFTASDNDTFVLEVKEKLPPEINWLRDDQLEEKIGWIFEGLYSDYLHISFKSLSEGGFEHGEDADNILAIILRDVLLAKCESNRAEGKKILDAFLSNRYLFPIFRRYVLLCVDKYWSDYAGLLDVFFKLVPIVLGKSEYEVELHDIFSHHNDKFNSALKVKIKEFINNVPPYYMEKGEKSIAYWKYEWLSPLRENAEFKPLYEEAKKTTEPKDDKPYEPERSSFKVGTVVHKSPISYEDILQKPITELAKYLKEFKGADSWHGAFEGEPDKQGLANTLQAAVKENPNKFIDGLSILSNAGYFYIHRVLAGLKEAWNSNKENGKFVWSDDEWSKIFDFLIIYLSRDKDVFISEALQAQGDDSGEGRYLWVVEDIVDLIADGCRDDKRAFDPKYFDKAEKIFDLVLPLLKGEKHPDTQRDAITYALNTTLGRTIMAYISFALRVARATNKKKEAWGKQKYERFFAIGIEAFIWFGRYLWQMRYLDKKYTDDKIDCFAKKNDDDFGWQNFIEGYLTGGNLYHDLYRLMRPNYLKALEYKIFKKQVDKMLVQHICLGYLQVGELLQPNNNDGQDSLFWKMLVDAGKLGKSERWLEVASFFWSITGRIMKKKEGEKVGEEDTSDQDKNKILEFWAWTYAQQDIVKSNLGNDYNSFLGSMSELTILLDKIDEEKEKWLLLCAPHIDCHNYYMMFVEALAKFRDEESIKRIGNIYLKVLENITPTYNHEDIILIVSRIYEKGDPHVADVICNTYGRRGVDFIRPVWEKYQKKRKSPKSKNVEKQPHAGQDKTKRS